MTPHEHVAEQTVRPESDTRGGTVMSLEDLIDQIDAIEGMTNGEAVWAAGIEPVYSSSEVAEFFGRTTQWVYWGLRSPEKGGTQVFTYADGSPIVPERMGGSCRAQRRFTLSDVRAIMESCYRRGTLDPDRLRIVVRRIKLTELGIEWRQREGWRYVAVGRKNHRWVRPDKAVFDEKSGAWKRRPASKKPPPEGES